MAQFRDWLRQYKEQAVPQTVDLTSGGKADMGTQYWGAVPKTGSGEIRARRRKRKKPRS